MSDFNIGAVSAFHRYARHTAHIIQKPLSCKQSKATRKWITGKLVKILLHQLTKMPAMGLGLS